MLNLTLPTPPSPAGSYEAFVIRKGIGMVSGQFPFQDGKLKYLGQVGTDLSRDQGRSACKLAAMNLLAQISAATNSFAELDGLLRLDGTVASAADFIDQPSILDVASELMIDVLGTKGSHSRTAFAAQRLPLNASIELCVTFAVR